MEAELEFLLEHAGRYLTRDPGPEDVLSTFAGLRPLVNDAGVATSTSALARDHTLHISASGLVTIAGGKWTTYRKMAEDTVDQATLVAGLEERPCVTRDLHIHGHHRSAEQFGSLHAYGSDAPEVRTLLRESPELAQRLHPGHEVAAGEVVWAARNEMARTVEDFLARRCRLLLLDARASMEAAPAVARLLAAELGRDDAWQRRQVEEYRALARGYLVNA
jgi:glycerol-3-phosphate dehydrogenase